MIPPALQPDDTCSDLYRLPWGAVAVQGAALLMAAAATATRTVRKVGGLTLRHARTCAPTYPPTIHTHGVGRGRGLAQGPPRTEQARLHTR